MIDESVVLVTGASRGIGRSIALKFARENYAIALTARSEEALNAVSKEIKDEFDTQTLVIPADLRNFDTIAQISETVLRNWGRIDVLVNNAGLGYLKPFLQITLGEFREMIDVNLTAIFALTQNVVPVMMENKGGTIINIASLAGKNGFKLGTGYAASKWALRGFAQCLMLEVREHDIRIVTLFPGSVETSFSRGGQSPTTTPSKNKMQPEDIADAAFMAVKMPSRTMVSEIDLRPSNPSKL